MGDESPLGEVAEFYAWLREYWCADPDDVDEYIEWNGETVTATTDILDALAKPVDHAMYHGIPKRIEVKRNEPR